MARITAFQQATQAGRVRTRAISLPAACFATLISALALTLIQPIGAHADDPLAMYLSDMYTLSANLAGIPGISVPCGFSADGLPIGLQLQAGHFQEERLLAAAQAFEQATDFHQRKPAS